MHPHVFAATELTKANPKLKTGDRNPKVLSKGHIFFYLHLDLYSHASRTHKKAK